MACQEQAVFRLSWSSVYSLFWKTTFVHNTQFAIYLRPVSNRTGPFFVASKVARYSALKGPYRLGIRFSADSASGRWNSGIQSHWWYKSPFWPSLKTWKLERWHPSYPSSVSWNSDIWETIFQLHDLRLPALSFHLRPDKWSSDPLQMLFCPCQGHISVCFLPGVRYSADTGFWKSSSDCFFDAG